ncbi:MAG: hypothetical protein MJ149_02475 [Clostridia bacterium]|nr:hypothetical protein [Clostridia bacterium]
MKREIEPQLFEKIAKGNHLLAKIEIKRANKPQTLLRKKEKAVKDDLKNISSLDVE